MRTIAEFKEVNGNARGDVTGLCVNTILFDSVYSMAKYVNTILFDSVYSMAKDVNTILFDLVYSMAKDLIIFQLRQ